MSYEIFQSVMTFPEIWQNGYFLGLLVFFFSLLQSTLSQASTHILCIEGIRLKTALQVHLKLENSNHRKPSGELN